MATRSKDLTILSLEGGLNDTDAVVSLAPDYATVANNVEFHCSSREERSKIAVRRAGCEAITTPITAGSDVVLLHRHFPTTDPTETELWAIDVLGAATLTVRYKDTSWHTVTQTNSFVASGTDPYNMYAQSLHGKLFIAGNSSVDRLHVRDAGSTTLRMAGLGEPAAPTANDSGGAGSLTGTRYYRVRYTVQSGGTTLRRSEPSDVLTFAPSGSNASITITKPASISESETHWELEASLDNNLFYVLATTVVGTTTVVDSTAFSTGYATAYDLSEDIGDYAVLHSAKYLAADDDRLLLAGSWEDEALSARVAWTPVKNDPGAGNDERSPIDTDNFIDLDTQEGGEITGISKTVNGYIFVFKWNHIYQLTRTGQRTRAYTSHCLTKIRGAIPGSISEGLDQNGRPAVYFIDPRVGPCRIGEGGIQTCGKDVHQTFEALNLEATVASRSFYYPDSSQIHWCIALNEDTTPSVDVVLHTNMSRQFPDGVRRGWVKFTGARASAISACLFADNIEDGVARSHVLRPLIGTTEGLILLCDTGEDDNGTAYEARIRSAPISLDIINQFGMMESAIVAKGRNDINIRIRIIRDFGREEKEFVVDLTPEGSEDPVIVSLDQVNMSEANAIQVEFLDNDPAEGDWSVYMFAGAPRSEGN